MVQTIAVASKELRQILRDQRTLLILLFIPAFFLLLFGYALNFDIRNVTLAVQDNQLATAESSLKKYIELAQQQQASEERSRGLAQAYLSMAQVAEKRRDFTAAGAWLDRIENSQDLLAAQNRRASILARQGKMAEARKLIQ